MLQAATSKALWRLVWVGLCAALCGGCMILTDPESTQVHQNEIVATVESPGSIGQSLVARRSRLKTITLWTNPAEEGQTQLLQAALYHSPQDSTAVYSTTLSARNGQIQLDLPALDNPPNQSYYLRLQAIEGILQMKGRNDDVYAQGTAFLNDLPLEADLAFSTTYRYDFFTLLEDLAAAIPSAWLLLPLAAALLLPGWWLLKLLPPQPQIDLWERLALACGLSLALIPLLLLWTSTLGLNWSQNGVRLATLLLGIAALLQIGREVYRRRSASGSAGWVGKAMPGWGSGWALAAILAGTAIVRMIMARDLSSPAWVDSYHHALLGRLILDSGRLPSSLQPYLGILPTDYHLGFHSGLALFTWLSGLELPQALLIYGQAQNTLAALAAYLLTLSLSKDRRAGVAAALFTGLVSPMPAYYISWGRYTHLSGLLIAVALLALLERLAHLSNPRDRLRTALLAAIAGAGLVLTHYQVAAFTLCLLLAYVLFFLLPEHGLAQKATSLGWFAAAGLLALLLGSPWLLPALSQSILPRAAAVASPAELFADFSWRHLTTANGPLLLGLAWMGLSWGLLRQTRFTLTLAGWLALLLLLGNLNALGLPGGRHINMTAVLISFFLPLSALAGWAASQSLQAVEALLSFRIAPGWARGLLVALAIGVAGTIGLQGGQALVPLLNTGTALLRSGDLQAAAWVEENLPPGEPIAVNAFPWGYGLYSAADGGGWLPALTLHPTLPPPVLYGLEETVVRKELNNRLHALQNAAQSPEQIADILSQAGVRYLYLGSRGGQFSPRLLSSNPRYHLLYRQNGVTIFEITPAEP